MFLVSILSILPTFSGTYILFCRPIYSLLHLYSLSFLLFLPCVLPSSCFILLMLLPSSSFFPPLYYSSIFSPIVHILHLFFVSSSTSSSPIPPPHQHISSHPVHSPHISNRVKDVPSKSIPPQRVKIKIPRFHSTPHPPLTTSSLAPDSFKSPRMLTRRVNPAGGPGVTSSRPQDRLRHPLPARHRPFLCKSTQAATTKGPFENLCKSKSRIISNNR